MRLGRFHFLLSFVISTHAVAASVATNTLRVLTYNVWGLPSFLETAPWRYFEIAKRLQEYDVIAIQEAWDEKTDILWRLHHSHPYRASTRKTHGLTGASGLMLLSKYPIVASESITYSECRYTDCLEEKGAVAARIELKPGLEIDVYTTHLNAWERYADIRSQQIGELIAFVRRFSRRRPVILTGDLNADFGSENYQQVRTGLFLRDAYDEFVRQLPHPTLEQLSGFTFDVQRNAWAHPERSGETESQRLDYILFQENDRVRLTPLQAQVCFRESIPSDQGPMPLSDHFGVSVLLGVDTPGHAFDQIALQR